MNQFKCRHCDKPAHFYFREGGMLCVDHAEAFCLAQAQDMLERSRLDKSNLRNGASQAPGPSLATGMSGDSANAGGEHEEVTPLSFGTRGKSAVCESTSLIAADLNVEKCRTGTGPGASGPERDIFGALKSACASLEGCPSRSSSEVRPGSDGVPAQGRPSTPFDDLPVFPERRNATTFRVTADNSIQGSPSSFSMGTAGHGAIVDAHNTIVRGG